MLMIFLSALRNLEVEESMKRRFAWKANNSAIEPIRNERQRADREASRCHGETLLCEQGTAPTAAIGRLAKSSSVVYGLCHLLAT